MRRYNVPRLIFVNKLDRAGASPWRAIAAARDKLKLNAAAVQIPIGLEDQHRGVVCLVTKRAFVFDGAKGETVRAWIWLFKTPTSKSYPPTKRLLREGRLY